MVGSTASFGNVRKKQPGIRPVAPGGGSAPLPFSAPATPAFTPEAAPDIMGAQAVRATGEGPFDAGYRQNLATFAGGDFERPEGGLSFNPTAPDPFGGSMPSTLIEQSFKKYESFKTKAAGQGPVVPGGGSPLFVPSGQFRPASNQRNKMFMGTNSVSLLQ